LVAPLQQAAGGMQRIRELLEEPPGTEDVPGARPLPPLEREIAFRDVSFSYGGPALALSRATLTIPRGTSVAVVGPSGCGKSTLLSLLLRFRDPTDGTISVDGFELRAVTQDSLRAQIGVVFQENFLFNATIRENIRLARPGAT